MKARLLLQTLAETLAPLYDPREARQIALLVAADRAGLGDRTAPLVADPEREIAIGEQEAAALARRLAAGEPVQYPRPETEELVDWVRRAEPAARRLLDVGTGSGCIAATLALELPAARITAVDCSAEALAVARENAERLGAAVDFRQADALAGLERCFAGGEPFDVIVSNPPYVPARDRATMHPNVRDYEPALALFVPDEDPLRFYRAIAAAGRTLLRPGGALYFEIYHEAGDALRALLAAAGYTQIELRCDLQGKPRMLCGRKNALRP